MSRPAENRVYHQDYIARIRYSNALPPPPNPPKLLNIPGTGLADGHYTSASYASRMAREQPLNIEADAELGMPINLVGLPGIFDDDESAISGLDNPPPPHPHDKPLLRSVAALGKPMASNTGVSFLRRTEYISSDAGRTRFESTTSKDLVKPKSDARKRKRPDVERTDDPTRIKRAIMKGFDLAYPQDADTAGLSTTKGPDALTAEDRKHWNNPTNPTNSALTVLDSYPLLPDPSATTDTGTYLIAKFQTNPVPLKSGSSYDSRLDVGILRPIENADDEARRQALIAAHNADPKNIPIPEKPLYEYEFYLPAWQDDHNVNGDWEYTDDAGGDSDDVVHRLRRRLDVNDPRRDDDDLYHAAKGGDEDGETLPQRYFVYRRLRRYETYRQVNTEDAPFGDVVALALHDPPLSSSTAPNKQTSTSPPDRLQKAAYFYPVMQRSNVRAKRTTVGAASQMVDAQLADGRIDYLDVVIRGADAFETAAREAAMEGLYFGGGGEGEGDGEGEAEERETGAERADRIDGSKGEIPRGFLRGGETAEAVDGMQVVSREVGVGS